MYLRFAAVVVGASSVLGALLALSTSVRLDAVDRVGEPIPCGDGFNPHYSAAQRQDLLNLDQSRVAGPIFMVSDYADQCATLITERRVAATGVAVTGGVLFAAALVVPRGRRQLETADVGEAVSDQPDHVDVPGVHRLDNRAAAGPTQPILQAPVRHRAGRHRSTATAPLSLRRESRGVGGEGELYAIPG